MTEEIKEAPKPEPKPEPDFQNNIFPCPEAWNPAEWEKKSIGFKRAIWNAYTGGKLIGG